MGMCSSCAALKKSYEDLLKQLMDAKKEAEDMKNQISGLQKTFENVKIDSEPVGNEEFNNCSTSFSVVVSELGTSINDCQNKIDSIVCTHLDDDDDDK